MSVRLDIMKPGSGVAVATQTAGKTVGSDPAHDLGKPQVVLWADTPAAMSDVGLGQASDALAFLPVTMNGDGKTQIAQLRNVGGRLGFVVYSPQAQGGYAASWSTPNIGQGSGAIGFLPVTMNGDGRTQIVQLWNNGGRLGLIVYSPQPDGSYAGTWGTGDMGEGSNALAFLPVTMNGDGKTQIVQLSTSGTRLAFTVYSPQADSAYRVSWSAASPQGAGAIKFLPVTMNGDGRTQIVQLWNNGGRLSFLTYAPQANGSYAAIGGTADGGQSPDAIAFLPVTMNGDGKTQIVQLWNSGGRLGVTVYTPQPDGAWGRGWSTSNIGEGAGAIGFLPVDLNGNGKTHIAQLWNNGGRLGLIVYSPQPDGSYAGTWGTGDMGEGSNALAFLPVTMNGDGKTQIAQAWDNQGKLGLIAYAPQADASYVVAWVSQEASWTAKVTNTGAVPVTCDLTVRYQTMEGNLGKIDHIVVMMMENRSFDHMLGYLSLEKGRADVNGLSAEMVNLDDELNPHVVHHRTDTYFRNDPGHGFSDVAEQLIYSPGTPGNSVGNNKGFVHNFAGVLDKAAGSLPPVVNVIEDQGQIAGGDSRGINFRPDQPGTVSLLSTVDRLIKKSESGKLGSVTLNRPGKPGITQVFPLGAMTMGFQYTATEDDLASPGDWSCVVFNGSDETANFASTVTYVQSVQEEPADAVMAYYNGEQLPAYDMLAREYGICDRWFAALPTDTWPNRLYALSGGSEMLNNTPSTADVLMVPPDFKNKTIFEVMEDHGQPWKIFFHDIPFALVYSKLAQDRALHAAHADLLERRRRRHAACGGVGRPAQLHLDRPQLLRPPRRRGRGERRPSSRRREPRPADGEPDLFDAVVQPGVDQDAVHHHL